MKALEVLKNVVLGSPAQRRNPWYWVAMVLGVVLLVVAKQAYAHGGGVDAQGCHQSAKAGRHCHQAREKVGTLPGGETQAQRNKRWKAECKGLPNAGACLGFGTR